MARASTGELSPEGKARVTPPMHSVAVATISPTSRTRSASTAVDNVKPSPLPIPSTVSAPAFMWLSTNRPRRSATVAVAVPWTQIGMPASGAPASSTTSPAIPPRRSMSNGSYSG